MKTDNGMTRTFKPKFTITDRITSGLTRIERARGFLEAATLSEDWVREMGTRTGLTYCKAVFLSKNL